MGRFSHEHFPWHYTNKGGAASHRSSSSTPHAKAATGDYVVAKNDEEEATFKQYKRFNNTKILHPLNPKYSNIVLNKNQEHRIIGVVMEKKRYK